jgi:hypothetical protein
LLFRDELVAGEPLDLGSERVEERVRRIEETDQLRAEVHRHDQPRRGVASELRSIRSWNRWSAAHRNEEHVHASQRLPLLGTQRGLAEVAEMRDAQPVELEPEDDVRTPGRAGHGIMLGRDPHDLAERSRMGAGRADDRRIAADDVGSIVVEVIMSQQDQVRLDAFDRRVAPLDAAISQPRHVAERVDEDAVLLADQQECGLAVPADAHTPDPSRLQRTPAGTVWKKSHERRDCAAGRFTR